VDDEQDERDEQDELNYELEVIPGLLGVQRDTLMRKGKEGFGVNG